MSKLIELWAESEAEAREFLQITNGKLDFELLNIFIAKRSSGKRDVGSGYINGEYYKFDINKGLTSKEVTEAPLGVVKTVQWCSQDMILTKDGVPFIVIESTYHILVFNNIAQRIPRQVRAADTGTTSVIFQKVNKDNNKLNAWFAETFLRATKIFNQGCLAIMFTDDEFANAVKQLCTLINECYHGTSSDESNRILASMKVFAEDFDEQGLIFTRNGKPRTWLEVDVDTVTVKIGVKDNCVLIAPDYGCQGDNKQKREFRAYLRNRPVGVKGCVWLSKGTGGMDPYPGLAKMAEILFAYDTQGKRTKNLVVEFSKLPEGFWWFKQYPNEIYYRLVKEFADTVKYADDFKA